MNCEKRAHGILRTPFALAIAGLTFIAPCQAQSETDTYPSKPMRLIVGFTPAAATDLVARALAQKLSDQMNISVIVDNRPGAGGSLAYVIGAKAAPDGYTLMFNTGGLVQNYALYSNLPYHPLRDFAPIAMVSQSPLLLVAKSSLPTATIGEFVNYARKNPDKLSYSSAGNGNVTHLGNILFQQAVGIKAVHIPYNGSAPALTDVIGGRIDYSTPTVASAMPFLADKRLRPLVVMSLKRSAALPDVPTASETVAPQFEVSSWNGVIAPAKTPSSIIARLNREISTAMQSQEFRSRLLATGAEPMPGSAADYKNYISSELNRWTAIIKASGLKLD